MTRALALVCSLAALAAGQNAPKQTNPKGGMPGLTPAKKANSQVCHDPTHTHPRHPLPLTRRIATHSRNWRRLDKTLPNTVPTD